MQTRRHGNSALSYPRLKALYAAYQLGTRPRGLDNLGNVR
jgi:hypothetical protein